MDKTDALTPKDINALHHAATVAYSKLREPLRRIWFAHRDITYMAVREGSQITVMTQAGEVLCRQGR